MTRQKKCRYGPTVLERIRKKYPVVANADDDAVYEMLRLLAKQFKTNRALAAHFACTESAMSRVLVQARFQGNGKKGE